MRLPLSSSTKSQLKLFHYKCERYNILGITNQSNKKMKKTILIIIGVMVALAIASFFVAPSVIRNHYFSQAVEQDSLHNSEKALELYKKAADWKHAEGAYRAGELLFNAATASGDTLKRNESISYFEQGSALGYKEANYMLGVSRSLTANPDTTIIFAPLRKDCGTKDADAKMLLGQYYMQFDTNKAIVYLDMAAKTLPLANNMLYKLYMSPSSSVADANKAKEYLLKGAEQGDAELQCQLGHDYLNGTNGVSKDSEKGFQLLKACADKGYSPAYTSLGWCYLNSAGTALNLDEAVKWINKGVESGDANAKYLLGLCYGNGWGVVKNDQQAIKLISEAAGAGCADAVNALAQLRRQSQPVVNRQQTRQTYQGPKHETCQWCGGSGYRHGVNMGLPVVGRDVWGNDIVRCDKCAGRGYTFEY